MKSFIIFITCSICFATSAEVFGKRLSPLSSSKNFTQKETVKSEKDLSTDDSYRTYEYVLPPIEVQRFPPKVIAEEHTIHELPPLTPALPMHEHVYLTDSSHAYSPELQPKPHIEQRHDYVANDYGNNLPVYKDDPKEQLKSYAPIYLEQTEPLSQIKPIESRPPVSHPVQQSYGHSDYIPGIPGIPWKDYPLFNSIPYTNFKCGYTKYPGYYADIETGCQVWHYCQLDGRHDRFLCANGTLFNQKTRVCDWWYNVDCHSAPSKYDINGDLYRKPHQNYIPVNPLNNHKLELPLDQLQALVDYQKEIDPYSGSLIFAESQSVPQKIIKRVRKVRISNNSTNTESGLLKSKK